MGKLLQDGDIVTDDGVDGTAVRWFVGLTSLRRTLDL
jgi:hypothetical protein